MNNYSHSMVLYKRIITKNIGNTAINTWQEK